MKKKTSIYISNHEKILKNPNEVFVKNKQIQIKKINTTNYLNQSFYKPITKLLNLDEL